MRQRRLRASARHFDLLRTRLGIAQRGLRFGQPGLRLFHLLRGCGRRSVSRCDRGGIGFGCCLRLLKYLARDFVFGNQFGVARQILLGAGVIGFGLGLLSVRGVELLLRGRNAGFGGRSALLPTT